MKISNDSGWGTSIPTDDFEGGKPMVVSKDQTREVVKNKSTTKRKERLSDFLDNLYMEENNDEKSSIGRIKKWAGYPNYKKMSV